MAKKTRALGRGLGALIEDASYEELEQKRDGFMELDVNLIDLNKDQPRKTFEKEALEELADSIRVHGIIQPIIVAEQNGRYKIVAGERRYRAARLAALKTVPVVIREVDDSQLLQLAIIENIQREDLNPVEEAMAIKLLMDKFSLNQEEAAVVLGRSRSAIANTLRLLNLPETIQQFVVNGKLSAGHARTLVPIKDQKLIVFAAEYIIENALSVREAEEYIKKLLGQQKKRKVIREKPTEFVEAERVLGELFDTKVHVSGTQKKGKITLEYYSQEQLFAIYDMLKSMGEG